MKLGSAFQYSVVPLIWLLSCCFLSAGDRITFQRNDPGDKAIRLTEYTLNKKLSITRKNKEGKHYTHTTKKNVTFTRRIEFITYNRKTSSKARVNYRHPMLKLVNKINKEGKPPQKNKNVEPLPIAGNTYIIKESNGTLDFSDPDGEELSKEELTLIQNDFLQPGKLYSEEPVLSDYLAGRTVESEKKLFPKEDILSKWKKTVNGKINIREMWLKLEGRHSKHQQRGVFSWKIILDRYPEKFRERIKLTGELVVGIQNCYVYKRSFSGPITVYPGTSNNQNGSSEKQKSIGTGSLSMKWISGLKIPNGEK